MVQIGEKMNPIIEIEKLMDVGVQVQKQLEEAMRILQFRDRQIDAAIGALTSIGLNKCCGTCQEAALVAGKALDAMRKIHKESLTQN
jgi:hypothetical protein